MLEHVRQDLVKLRTSHILSPRYRNSRAPSRLDGLFGSARAKKLAQLHACFVQLRLAVADGTTNDLGNLIMLVTLHIVEYKYAAIARGQPVNSILQLQAVDGTGQNSILGSEVFLLRLLLGFVGLVERDQLQSLFAEAHQDNIDGHPVQPGREGGFPAEGADLTEQLQESFLSQILGLSRIGRHTQTQGVNAPPMQVV